MVGQGFVFDGNGDEVLIGNPASLRLQTFTVEMWLKRSSATAASKDGSSAANLFGYGTFGYAVGIKDGGGLFLSLTYNSFIWLPVALADWLRRRQLAPEPEA